MSTAARTVADLEQVRPMLQGYCRALAGPQVQVDSCAELVQKKIGWVRDDVPTSDGVTVYLPSTLDGLSAEEDVFSWYKVMATHQVGHIEWGSYDFRFGRPSTLFDDLRSAPPQATRSSVDYSRYFGSFDDPLLARDIFRVAEDYRIDCRIVAQYSGLAPLYVRAQRQCLARRPPMGSLSEREAVVESLVRLSLGHEDVSVAAARAPARILRELGSLQATVEDAAEATIRIYALVCSLTGPYRSPAMVSYRGEFKPELGQVLVDAISGGASRDGASPGSPLGREQLEELLEASPEIDLAPGNLPDHLREKAVVDNLREELAGRSPPPGDDDGDADGAQDGRLEPSGPGTFAYDEWDAGQMRYRERFCLVHERELPTASNTYFESTLKRHASLAHEIRRQFEAVACQMLRKETRQRDGEELDLDAVVDSIVDRRVGKSPTDKLFSRRNKTERSVAVAFLLDMSASTADPVDRNGTGAGASSRRIVDLEKEALVLLIHALSVLGDAYGVYGFSGYGRECIDFYLVKELHERLSTEVIHRIDAIEPRSATRMGPAIRHATTKLLQHGARSRYLFLISDGRPQDRGYGNPGESRQYAVEDTRAALLAARRHGIRPFCLAVDKHGHDYLGAMMQDMGYEVLWDVAMLPRKLPELYRALTT